LFPLAAWFLAVWVCTCSVGGATSPAAPTTQPAATTRSLNAAELFAQGLAAALKGDFNGGLKLVDRASRISPRDKAAGEAKDLLEDYLRHYARAEAQRAEEYAAAVARVKRCQLAQAYLPKLAAAVREKLRGKVEQAAEAHGAARDSIESSRAAEDEVRQLRARAAANRRRAGEVMKAAATTRPADAPEAARLINEAEEASQKAASLAKQAAAAAKEALEHLDAAGASVKAAALLAKDDSAYAKTFRSVSEAARKALAEYRGVWAASKADTEAQAVHRAHVLGEMEDGVAEALSDLSALVDEKPWRVALSQGRLAKDLAAPDDEVENQAWYRSLVADAEARGAKAVAEARWYDALNAYAGLEDLEQDNETYRRQAKTVRRHVRVLGLYGGGNGEATTAPAAADQAAWRDMVAGVDAEMVKSAISQLDMFYVTAVDYRKVIRGALESVRILADTPQAARAFKGLADKEKKGSFLGAVDAQIEAAGKQERVDHMDLVLALTGVLRASERSVELPTEVLAVEFADGLLGELDRFSSMVWPHDVTDFHKNTMGHFFGVGIQITKDPGEPLKVVTPLADSPALKAGIRTDDLIVAVNGTGTKNLTITKLIGMIMGEKGTKVTLTIERRGRPAPFDVDVIRARISIKTVKGWCRREGGKWDYLVDGERGVGYVRVTQFTDKTPSEIREALEGLRQELAARDDTALHSLIIDLRFNPGGLLRAATQVANEFLTGGRIVATRGRQKRPLDVNADRKGAYLGGNLVVLVNEQSASAAEIVSGAIKDRRRGMILGERTFGKGSVQNVIPLSGREALLKLTTAYYYVGDKGRLVHRRNGARNWGVDPDIEVFITPRQTKRWLGIRYRTDRLMETEPDWLQDDLKRQYEEDIQLQTAVLLLRLMRLQHG
jgi:carboxyl-terminal processing protease